jgi:hypothetical protein
MLNIFSRKCPHCGGKMTEKGNYKHTKRIYKNGVYVEDRRIKSKDKKIYHCTKCKNSTMM